MKGKTMEGTIKEFDGSKGCGLIETGGDIRFDADGFDLPEDAEPEKGDIVTFDTYKDENGEAFARNIRYKTLSGTIKQYDDWLYEGLIATDEGDIFFGTGNFAEPDDAEPENGDKVTFNLYTDSDGRICACNIVTTGKSDSPEISFGDDLTLKLLDIKSYEVRTGLVRTTTVGDSVTESIHYYFGLEYESILNKIEKLKRETDELRSDPSQKEKLGKRLKELAENEKLLEEMDSERENGEMKDYLRVDTFNGDTWEMFPDSYGFDLEEKIAELDRYLKNGV